jgi:hypothetical protein
VQRYLRTRAVQSPWRLAGEPGAGFHGVVVIPSLAEGDSLLATLDSLAANPVDLLARFLVVVVVNHRIDAAPEIKTGNLEDLQALSRMAEGTALPLAWVDAATPGLEMPLRNSGVGLARKIGMDLALNRLDWSTRPLLVSLDADTLVEPNYLAAIESHFERYTAGAATLAFCHQAAADPLQQAAIDRYELFVRSYVLGLARAGSPYAFATVGSAFACRALSYVRCGGMNRRSAGEDFYFLQQAAKIDGVAPLRSTRVHPSPRISQRTPFGTGASMSRLLAGDSSAVLFYPAKVFEILAEWLSTVAAHPDAQPEKLIDLAGGIAPELADFLSQAKFVTVWPGIQKNHPRMPERLKAFHAWFDGLKTLRLIHDLCAGSGARQEPEQALPELFCWCGLHCPEDLHEALELLRRHQEDTRVAQAPGGAECFQV